HWAMLPSTLEWHLGAVLVGLAALFWPPAWGGLATMLALSGLVAASQAVQAQLSPRPEGLLSRLFIAAPCYAQPLVRSWRRSGTRLFACSPPRLPPSSPETRGRRLPLTGSLQLAYWSENDCQRTELLGLFIAYLIEQRWGTTIDSGWSD